MASAKKSSAKKASSAKKGRTATATATATLPPQPWPLISGICPGDFGLKAGFRDPNTGGVTFREIVGWATVENYIETMRLPFAGVVINDDDHPTMCAKEHMPNFIGYFKTGVTASAAAKILEQSGVQVSGVRGLPRTVVE